MTTNYEKKLLNEIKELKEGSVPKDILFAERSGHRREIASMEKQIEKLKAELTRTVGRGMDEVATSGVEKALTMERNEARMKYNEEKERVMDVLQQLYGAKHHDWDCDWKTIASCVGYDEDDAEFAYREMNDLTDSEEEDNGLYDEYKARFEGEQKYEDK